MSMSTVTVMYTMYIVETENDCYLSLDSVVYYSFKEFSHVAAKSYASLLAAFPFVPFPL